VRQFRAQEKILRVCRIQKGCWIWTGKLTTKGYASFSLKTPFGRFLRHRGSYVAFGNPLKADEVLDHECRNRACMNPAHFRPMTALKNVMIGNGPAAINARKTHCKRGHPFIDGNIYLRGGRRYCRTCALLDAGIKFDPFPNGIFTPYKNRGPAVGSESGVARLTEEKVLEIRGKYRRGKYGAYRLAKEFGVTKGTIMFILQRRTWRHI
jgi:hypothetical protein